MKRVNIHIEEANLKALNKILKKLHSDADLGWWRSSITRADLIRYALAYIFGLEYTRIHVSADALKTSITKALKKAT